MDDHEDEPNTQALIDDHFGPCAPTIRPIPTPPNIDNEDSGDNGNGNNDGNGDNDDDSSHSRLDGVNQSHLINNDFSTSPGTTSSFPRMEIPFVICEG